MADDADNGKVAAAKNEGRNEARLEEVTRRLEDVATKLESIGERVGKLEVEVAKVKERQGLWAAGQAVLSLVLAGIAATLKQP